MARITNEERIARQLSNITTDQTVTNEATDETDCCNGLMVCSNCTSESGE